MAKKVEKVVPWMIILSICLMTVFAGGIVLKETEAADIIPSAAVDNVSPTVAVPTLNNATSIIVVGNTSTTVNGTTTITDTNGYTDISNATGTLFRIGATTCTLVTTDDRWCYEATCELLTATTDASRNASCTADVWYLAEPTEGTSSYAVEGWQMDITATDTASAAGTGSTSQELGSIYYIDASATIAYGTVALGATNSADVLTSIYNIGNVEFDPYLDGDDMVGAGTAATIAVGRQKYSDASLGDWVGEILTGVASGFDINLATPTATSTPSTDDIYWLIKMPTNQLADTYTGTNTVAAGAAL